MRMSGNVTAEAVSALRYAAKRRLKAAGWVTVGEALTVLEAGLAAGDESTVRHAIRALDGSRKPRRLGDPPDPDEEPVPSPSEIRERINKLLDMILPDTSEGPVGGGQAGG